MKLPPGLRTLTEFSAVTCAPGGGRAERISVPLHHGEVDLPSGDLDGILITGDLQFYDRADVPADDRQLLGFIVSSEIADMCEMGLLPPAGKIGVILAGDFYADPTLMKRGGSGNVDEIWEQFASDFRWVAGVAGNHDLFEGKDEFSSRLRKTSNIYALDGDSVSIDGLNIGGISGIEGNLHRPWRYDLPGFQDSARKLLNHPLDIFVLHQGPMGSKRGMRGSGLVNEVLRNAPQLPELITFGHCHWPEPVDTQENFNLLNCDARVILLTRRGVGIAM